MRGINATFSGPEADFGRPTQAQRMAVRLAVLYSQLPVDSGSACIGAYSALSIAVYERYKQLQGQGWVFLPRTYDPGAPSKGKMNQSFFSGVMEVSDINHNHPYWTNYENFIFRCTHEVDGHGLSNARFDFEGELRAFKRQAAVLLPILRERFSPARTGAAIGLLFVEVVGQAAFASTYGFFDVQRGAFLRADRR